MASLGRLGGRGEEMRSAVAESLLFLLLVASLLSVKGPLKIPLFFFSFSLPIYCIPKICKKGEKNHVICLVCVMLQSPWAMRPQVLAPQFGGCCRTVVTGVSLALRSPPCSEGCSLVRSLGQGSHRLTTKGFLWTSFLQGIIPLSWGFPTWAGASHPRCSEGERQPPSDEQPVQASARAFPL